MSTFGILDDHNLEHVPGTVILDDEVSSATLSHEAAGLKHGTGRYSHIVLAPQPSDDPNDPLVRQILLAFPTIQSSQLLKMADDPIILRIGLYGERIYAFSPLRWAHFSLPPS